MNKTPEQIARDNIDAMLERAGWVVVDKTAINWGFGPGLAVREYQTDVGPADYVLFVDREPMGVIEAKKETEGHRLSVHEQQAEYYDQSNLKKAFEGELTREWREAHPELISGENSAESLLARIQAEKENARKDSPQGRKARKGKTKK